MESIRVTAKTVEDAVLEASIQLGTSSDNIEYTVIEKGTSGFFGIGGKKAVIEAKRKFTEEDLMKEVFGEKTEKPKKEIKKENKKEFRKDRKEPKEFKKESKKETEKEAVKEPVKETEKKEVKEAAKEVQKEAVKETVKEASREKNREPKKESFKNSQKAAPSPVKTEDKPEVKSEKKDSEEAVKESAPKAPRVPANPEEATRRAETFLKDVFRTMEMNVEVKSVFEDDTLSIDLTGDDMGILIGKRGQTLDSLQYLTSLVVNKGKASYVRVKLDTEDYRNRRKATLENLAKNIAFKVKKTRRPVFLEPMNPYERRIIHSALQNDPYVTTHSEGDEPCRKVVVTLRKK